MASVRTGAVKADDCRAEEGKTEATAKQVQALGVAGVTLVCLLVSQSSIKGGGMPPVAEKNRSVNEPCSTSRTYCL